MKTETSQSASASFEAYHIANPVHLAVAGRLCKRINVLAEMIADERAEQRLVLERARYRRAHILGVADSVKRQIQRALRQPYVTSYTRF